MTIGWDAPRRPAPTGVADYAQRLMERLREDVAVVPAGREADRWFYHLGNNHLHRPIYERALARPDIVVLHDALLMHFFLGWLDEAGFVREFTYNYGEWYAGYAAKLWERRRQSGGDPVFFRHGLLRRVCEAARGVVVHNREAARRVREHVPRAVVHEIPHYRDIEPAVKAAMLSAWRTRHGIGGSTYVFGVFGYLRESKRVVPVLRSFARLAGRDTRLVLAGEFVSTDLERAAAPWLAHSGVIRVGRSSDEEFRMLLAAVDCGVNLRYPSAGESSGVGVRLMGLGKPVLVTEDEETKNWPQAVAIAVPPGVQEEPMLVEAMTWLLDHPGDGRAIGRRAAYFVEQHQSLDRVARLYLELVQG